MRICIISGANILCNPRTVKEADALTEAGHDVRVLSIRASTEWDQAIVRLLKGRKWQYEPVNYKLNLTGHARWMATGITTRTFQHLAKFSLEWGIAENAYCRFRKGQLRVALQEPTDLYIGHTLRQLPIVVTAARAQGAMAGFDFEDYHLDEHTLGPINPIMENLKKYLIFKYIPQCSYLSATSEKMADLIKDVVKVRRPIVLYNAFPLSDTSGVLPPDMRGSPRTVSSERLTYTAYWWSRMIDLDRGLQDFIQSMPRFNRQVTLHLRGQVHEGTKRELVRMATQVGVSERIFFNGMIYPEDLVRDAARFDFGLALEQPSNQNWRVTVSNKLFTYLLAGIVPVVTDVPGQREVMDLTKGCGVLYKPGDIDELAEKMNHLLTHPEQIMQGKKQAWEFARFKFCWDIEKQKLISAIQDIEKTKGHRY